MDRLLAFHGTLELEGLPRMLSSILRNQEKMIDDARSRGRQQKLFEKRIFGELDDIRGRLRALDSTSPATFPQFQRLPKEVKEMIWALTIPRRAHERIWYPKDGIDNYLASKRSKAPAIIQVCQESRAIALRYGQYYTVSEYLGGHQSPRPMRRWFSPELDIMIVTDDYPDNGCFRTAVKRIFLECDHQLENDPFIFPHIIIDSQFCGLRHNPGVTMPNLETAHVGFTLKIGREAGISFMSEFFGNDEVLLVDMEDTVAVRRMTRLLEGIQGKDAIHPKTPWELWNAEIERFMKDYEETLPSFIWGVVMANARGRSQEDQDTCITKDRRPNTALDWVRELIDSFEFRPGMLFVRDTDI